MLTPVPPTECTRAREAASARLDGELSQLELAQLEIHTAGCAACAEYAVLIAVTTGQLRSTPLELPAEPISVPKLRRRIRIVPAAAAAAVIAAVAASSFALGGALAPHRPAASRHPTTTAAAPIPAAADTTAPSLKPIAQLPLVEPQEQPSEIWITSKVIAV